MSDNMESRSSKCLTCHKTWHWSVHMSTPKRTWLRCAECARNVWMHGREWSKGAKGSVEGRTIH